MDVQWKGPNQLVMKKPLFAYSAHSRRCSLYVHDLHWTYPQCCLLACDGVSDRMSPAHLLFADGPCGWRRCLNSIHAHARTSLQIIKASSHCCLLNSGRCQPLNGIFPPAERNGSRHFSHEPNGCVTSSRGACRSFGQCHHECTECLSPSWCPHQI